MRKIVLALMALGALLSVASFAGREDAAQAAVVTFEARAVGAEENPPVTGVGTAFIRYTFDDVTRKLTYFVTVSGLNAESVIGAHLHRGARGVNGPIIYPLSNTGFIQVSGEVTIAEADMADIRAGNFYFNVHSKEFPGGFARAQFILPSAGAAAQAAAALPRTGSAGILPEHNASLLALGLAIIGVTFVGSLTFARKRA